MSTRSFNGVMQLSSKKNSDRELDERIKSLHILICAKECHDEKCTNNEHREQLDFMMLKLQQEMKTAAKYPIPVTKNLTKIKKPVIPNRKRDIDPYKEKSEF